MSQPHSQHSPETALRAIAAAGVSVTVDGADNLIIKPTSAVTPELVAILREYKSELVEWYRGASRRGSPLWRELLDVYADAYREMAAVGYYPAAPSDGMGHITVPLEERDQDAEAQRYARDFHLEENTRSFHLGVAKGGINKAFVWTVEAARLMCGGEVTENRLASKLLRMAAADYDRTYQEHARKARALVRGLKS